MKFSSSARFENNRDVRILRLDMSNGFSLEWSLIARMVGRELLGELQKGFRRCGGIALLHKENIP